MNLVKTASKYMRLPSTSLQVAIQTRYKSLVRLSPTIPKSRMEDQMDKCKVTSLDHLVLTVKDMDCSIDFYTRVLGMTSIQFGEGRKALKFGNQKINLHLSGQEFKPHAREPTPGSGDLCFVSQVPLTSWMEKLKKLGISIEEGPVNRTGATGPINSIYVRDPDGNLIEICNY